jgi:uncharacterized protein
MQKIRSLSIWLTERCNLNCAYCYEHRTERTAEVQTITDRIERLFLDDSMDLRADSYYVNFFGGEPLLEWDKLVTIAEWMDAQLPRPVRYGITTNATLLDDEKATWLAARGFGMLLSIDGDEQAMAARSGAYAATVAGAEAAFRAGLHPEGNMCFSLAQLDRWEENIGHLVELGFRGINLNPEEPANYDYSETFAVFREVFRKYALDWHQQGVRISAVTKSLQAVCSEAPPRNGCGAGKAFVAIGTDGTIYPCHHCVQMRSTRLATPEGRISGVEKGWWEAFDSRDAEECRTCTMRRYCLGSCAASNAVVMGDFHTPVTGTCTFMRARLAAALSMVYEMDQSILQEVLAYGEATSC